MKLDNTISALIIDDDLFSRDWLHGLLKKHYPHIQIIEMCESGPKGIHAINRWTPDIIFLDIEMPGMNGFEMLKQLPGLQSEIIFVTAHNQYAIKAIRFSALDYLLKPVKPAQLKEALERVDEKIRERKLPAQYKNLLSNIEASTEAQFYNLAIPTTEGLHFIELSRIIRCESDDRYTKIYMVDNKMILASRTLGDFEDLLQSSGFVRIHKSHLVNTRHLKKYIRGEGGQAIMSDGSIVDVARRKKDQLLQVVSQFQ